MLQIIFAALIAALCLAPALAARETPAASTEAALAPGASTGASAAASTGAALAPASTESAISPELRAILDRLDQSAAATRTLSADVAITHAETFTGHSTTRSGRIYLRKPDQLLLDLAKPYPQKTYVIGATIVDYRPDLRSADRVRLPADAEGRPAVIGLSMTSAELLKNFTISLYPGAVSDLPEAKAIVVEPRPEVKTDFTSATIVLDPATYLPVRIIQKNDRLDETKTFQFANIRSNADLPSDLFDPKLPPDTAIEEANDWKGP